MQKIEFAQVKLVPIGSVLRHYGVETRRSGEFLIVKNCPLPTHTSKKDLDTFKVNVKGNWWTCWSQSCRDALGKRGGDVIDFLRIKEHLDPLPAAKMITELFCLGGHHQANAAGHQAPAAPVMVPAMANKPLGFPGLQGIRPNHSMIQSRGITVETAAGWGVGYYRSKQGTASMDDRIVFPIHEDGHLVGYAGRTVLPVTPENPKWRLGKGLQRTFLYGIDRCTHSEALILCESPWEVLLGHQMGKQTVALVGCSMTEEQERRLERFGTIWVMMDNDLAGRKASDEIFARLKSKHKLIRSFLKD